MIAAIQARAFALICGVGFLLVVLFGIFVFIAGRDSTRTASTTETSRCTDQPGQGWQRDHLVDSLAAVNAERVGVQESNQHLRVDLSHDQREARSNSVDLGIFTSALMKLPESLRPLPNEPLRVTLGSITSDQSASRFVGVRQGVAYGSWDDINDRVVIQVCFDPLRPQVVEPGRYQGTATLSDPRFDERSIPLVINVQSPRKELVLWAALAAGVAGAWFGVASHVVGSPDRKDLTSTVSGHGRFFLSLLAFSVAAGLISGMWIYADVYQSNASFDADDGSSIIRQIGLPGAAFASSAFAIALTFYRAFALAIQSSKDSPSEQVRTGQRDEEVSHA